MVQSRRAVGRVVSALAGLVAGGALGGLAGWQAGRAAADDGPAPLSSPAAIVTPAPAGGGRVLPEPIPMRDLRWYPDGSVTVRWDRGPADELAAALHRPGLQPVARTSVDARAAVATGPSCVDDGAPEAAPPAATLVRALRQGSPDDQLRALASARATGADLPHDLLRHLVDNEPSGPVRLQAFEALADALARDANASRALLSGQRWNAVPAVRDAALRRLDELDRAAAAVPHDGPQAVP